MLKYFLSVFLAAVLWYLMFVVKPFENFWVMMAISTSILSVISLAFYKDQLKSANWNLKEILFGISSAVLLYGLFFIGKLILDKAGIIPDHQTSINSVYANRGQLPSYVVALLLFFPIGFGEEIFWRGFLQRTMSEKYGKTISLLVTTFFYVAVHIPTKNPILLLAALIVGLVWGLMFNWRNNIVAPMVSHMVWDPLIFVLIPFN
jgi:membrane protease YdiL (CAAX protease family)